MPTPWKVIGNFEGSEVKTAQIYKGKYEAQLEVPGGREGSKKNLPWRGMDIFWNDKISHCIVGIMFTGTE